MNKEIIPPTGAMPEEIVLHGASDEDIIKFPEYEDDPQLVIGRGEIGDAMCRYLDRHTDHPVLSVDTKDEDFTKKLSILQGSSHLKQRTLHICFGYDKDFIKAVNFYIEMCEPKLVIIHSTVPVGTTRKIGRVAVHSPVIGVHPDLLEGLETFPKMLGGMSVQKVMMAAQIFDTVSVYDNPEETESAKLLSTTYYAWNIVYQKFVHKFCEENNLSFDNVYTETNRNYNLGYHKLGKDNVIRPVLSHVKGPIGGHCVIPNAKLLAKMFEPAKFILKQNEKYGKKTTNTSKARDGVRRNKQSRVSKTATQPK